MLADTYRIAFDGAERLAAGQHRFSVTAPDGSLGAVVLGALGHTAAHAGALWIHLAAVLVFLNILPHS